MSFWESRRLGDLIEIKGGKRLPAGHTLQTAPNRGPYIRIKDVSPTGIDEGNLMYVPEAAQPLIQRYRVRTGEIFVSIVGTVGLIASIPQTLDGAFLTENAAKLTVADSCLNPNFLAYALRSPSGQRALLEQTVGSTQPKLALFRIKEVTIPLPPRVAQDGIVEVLSALDEKIAANRALVDSLDELFLATWGALNADTVGERVPLASLVEPPIVGDWGGLERAPDSPHRVQCVRGADIEGVQRFTLKDAPTRYVKPGSLSRRKLNCGDIVVEMSGGSPTQSTGRACIISESFLNRLATPVVTSNFCKTLRPRDISHAGLIYAELRTAWSRGDFFQFENGTTGIKNLAYDEYAHVTEILVPPAAELSQFSKTVESIFENMDAIAAESRTLAELRDTLLPELMSGRVRVKDAEKKIEEVM